MASSVCGVHDKLGEVGSDPHPGNNVLGLLGKLDTNDIIITRGKNQNDTDTVSGNALSRGDNCAKPSSTIVGKLTASVLAGLPAPLHYRQLQMLQSKGLLRSNQSYEGRVTLTSGSKDELQWWIYSLQEWNGKAIASSSPDLIITTDSSKIGWGAECQGKTTQGQWSVAEATKHINVLELTAAYFAV
jgi:hypothetical protein